MPKSAYIHVPFCGRRCGYCNFTLVAGRDDLIDAYLSALEAEMSLVLKHRRTVQTIFLGGGTPSHLSQQQLERLFSIIYRWFDLDVGNEFSSEVNPLDCTKEKLQLLADCGVNRISIGGQSFNNDKLKVLERDHTAEQLQGAIERCATHFSNISLDLIFAAPGETVAQWECDITTALTLPLQHLSTYGLTIERGSAFYGRRIRGAITESGEETQLQMYEGTIESLTRCSFEHYEVSNFALPGYQCQHNEAYWLGQPWWGFGPGAAAFSVDEDGSYSRSVNHQSTTTYIRRLKNGSSPLSETESLTVEQRVRERLVFGLRRLSGVSLEELNGIWGGPARSLFEPKLSEFIDRGWIMQDGELLRLSKTGLVISDSLWQELL